MSTPNVQFKTFPGMVKAFNDSDLVIEHFISTETQDSCGDVMLADGMKMRGAPVVLFQHGLDAKYGNEPIAKVLDIRVGEVDGKKGLIAKTKYWDGRHLNPPDNTGVRLYEKAKDGTMPNWSIGFNSIKEHPVKGGRVVEEWDLHEYSQVAVGMNAEATTLSSDAPELKFCIKSEDDDGLKELGFDSEDAFNEATEEWKYDDVDEIECREGTCKILKSKKDDEIKPYPSEHACRINDPSKFSKFRRQNGAREHDGKKYDAIYGQLKDGGKWTEQAYRYPKSAWTSDEAAAHCKSHDGTFEAAKSLPVKESKDRDDCKVLHERAHKAIYALHKDMLDELKRAAEEDDVLVDGAKALAENALAEFEDSVSPHVEKYIKAVRGMKDDDLFGDEEEDPEDAPDEETKGFRASHKALNEALRGLVKSIRSNKGKKEVVAEQAAIEHLKVYHEAALPHAIEYVKNWRERFLKPDEPVSPEIECKPALKRFYLQMTKSDKEAMLKVLYHLPKAVPSASDKDNLTAQEKVVRIITPVPEPAVKIMVDSEPAITASDIKDLFGAATATLSQSIVAELRRAAGRVTK